MFRNGWSQCSGIGGNNKAEWVVTLLWNTQAVKGFEITDFLENRLLTRIRIIQMFCNEGDDSIDNLLSRSAELEQKMIRMLMHQPYDDSDRVRISKVMCSVAFEHAESFKMLLASRNFTSAVGMLRLQFESLVRGVWVLYAASDIELSKLTAELNSENSKHAGRA